MRKSRTAVSSAGLLLFASLTSLHCACRSELAKRDCDKLLEKYVELLARHDLGGVSSERMLRLKLEAKARAERDPHFAECQARVSRKDFECAMRAADPGELERCML